ncbi:MAG: helix-turn-helix transcriptional regulator [Bacteroidota bacterium]
MVSKRPIVPQYDLFFKFIETYAPVGYQGIDRDDPLIVDLEKLTEQNNQFFFIGDVIESKVIWASKRSHEMIGIRPENLTAYHFMEATHPEDYNKHSLGRAKMYSMGNDFFVAEKGKGLLSINIRIRNLYGEYPDLLFQLYFFYHTIPYKSTFLFTIITNIESFKKRKHGYHYYVGHDLTNFRYPDEELLALGVPFSDHEFEIIKLIASGLNSEQIAEKKFLSIHTVNTHRKNILSKAGEQTMGGLIFKLMKQGLL